MKLDYNFGMEGKKGTRDCYYGTEGVTLEYQLIRALMFDHSNWQDIVKPSGIKFNDQTRKVQMHLQIY